MDVLRIMLISISLYPLAAYADWSWEYERSGSSHYAEVTPMDKKKLSSFSLHCGRDTEGQYYLQMMMDQPPVHPSRGNYGYTAFLIQVLGNTDEKWEYNLVMRNHARFPEFLTSSEPLDPKLLLAFKNGEDLLVWWERWDGRLIFATVPLKRSMLAITKLQDACRNSTS